MYTIEEAGAHRFSMMLADNLHHLFGGNFAEIFRSVVGYVERFDTTDLLDRPNMLSKYAERAAEVDHFIFARNPDALLVIHVNRFDADVGEREFLFAVGALLRPRGIIATKTDDGLLISDLDEGDFYKLAEGNRSELTEEETHSLQRTRLGTTCVVDEVMAAAEEKYVRLLDQVFSASPVLREEWRESIEDSWELIGNGSAGEEAMVPAALEYVAAHELGAVVVNFEDGWMMLAQVYTSKRSDLLGISMWNFSEGSVRAHMAPMGPVALVRGSEEFTPGSCYILGPGVILPIPARETSVFPDDLDFEGLKDKAELLDASTDGYLA